MPYPKELPIRLCAVLFIITAIAKLYAVYSHAPLALTIDFVLGIPNRLIFALVGMLELGLGIGLVICPKSRLLNATLIVTSLCILLYRLLWLSLGRPEPCSCLGGLLGHSAALNNAANWILTVTVVVSLFCGLRTVFALPANKITP